MDYKSLQNSSLLGMAKGETHAQQYSFPVKPRYLFYLFKELNWKVVNFCQSRDNFCQSRDK